MTREMTRTTLVSLAWLAWIAVAVIGCEARDAPQPPRNAVGGGEKTVMNETCPCGLPEKTFVHEGRRIAYVEAGAGEAILLVHGGSCDHSDYREQFGPLSKHFRVIAPDAPFFGNSDPGPLPRDLRQTASALWALLDHLGVRRVVLVGHSGGALMCMNMYLAQPQRVRAFVSVDSGTGGKLGGEMHDRPIVLSKELQVQFERNRAELAKLKRLHDYPSDVNTARLKHHRFVGKPRYLKATGGMGAVTGAQPPEPKWCKAPLLLFTAGRGRMGQDDLPPGFLQKRAAGENARVVVIRESGHWIMLEQPETFNRELIRFVQALPDP